MRLRLVFIHDVIINLYVKYDLEDMYAPTLSHTQDTHTLTLTHTLYIDIYE
jgi:hypothetical protein